MPETTQFGELQDNGYSEDALKANTILMNRWKILGTLGGGGQGAVYQCRDLNFPDAKRLVAIKEVHYPKADPGVRAATMSTFRREANILATLSHPAIPKIHDFFDQNNRAYLVMEYINGSDLELLLTKTKELPMNKILEWAIDLCDVLHYLHSHQPEPIIFRDVKPANIMIDSLGKVRLIDFGIAKKFQSGAKHTMIGTEGYSAPEQYKGDVSPLSDIYSLGATLHHILTRKDPRLEPPFSFNERPIQDFNPDAPSAVVSAVEKALEMDPSDRFQSCGEMKAALERARYGSDSAVAVGTAGGEGVDDEFGTGGTIQPRWTFTTEDEIRCSPTSFRNFAYVGSYDTNIWALDLESGEFKWKYPTRGGIASSPVVDTSNRLILFGSEDHSFTAVDYHSGRINWSYSTKGPIRSAPRVAHDHVFFGSDDGHMYALVAGNGRYLWDFDAGAPVQCQPYVTAELIIIGSESGDVFGLELSGTRKWSFRTRRRVTASPLVDEVEGICYVGSFDGYMYAVDASSGFSMWRFRTNGPIVSAAALDDGMLFFTSADGNLYAVNAESSKERWRFDAERPIVSSPVIYAGQIYFGDTEGYLYCLDARTGKETWRFQAGGAITSAPYIAENVILVGSMDKTVYALPLVSR